MGRLCAVHLFAIIYDPKVGQAEFAEKDEDYRGEMIAYLATALRDGPLPERTPKNDPTLTLDGPRVTDWKRIASESINAAVPF